MSLSTMLVFFLANSGRSYVLGTDNITANFIGVGLLFLTLFGQIIGWIAVLLGLLFIFYSDTSSDKIFGFRALILGFLSIFFTAIRYNIGYNCSNCGAYIGYSKRCSKCGTYRYYNKK